MNVRKIIIMKTDNEKFERCIFRISSSSTENADTMDSDFVTETLPSVLSETLTELQIRWGFDEDSEIIFPIPPCTVKILKFGTPQTIANIVLKIEKFDVTLHLCIQKTLMEWQTA